MSNRHARITEIPINIQQAFSFVQAAEHGAVSNFIGMIRNHNLGRTVTGVSYDVFVPLVEKVLQELCDASQQQWGQAINIFIEHFKGRLSVGEISVIVVVSSAHRDEAFKTCRYLIEGIKHQCPIWKQEHYIDGDSQWVKGHALCAHT